MYEKPNFAVACKVSMKYVMQHENINLYNIFHNKQF